MARNIGNMAPLDWVSPPTKVVSLLMQGGSSVGQTYDWTSTGSTAMTNAGTAGIHMVRLSGMTTAGSVTYAFVANLFSTGVAANSSGDKNSSTDCNILVTGSLPKMFQVPGGSTGFSVFAGTSGWVTIEMWRR